MLTVALYMTVDIYRQLHAYHTLSTYSCIKYICTCVCVGHGATRIVAYVTLSSCYVVVTIYLITRTDVQRVGLHAYVYVVIRMHIMTVVVILPYATRMHSHVNVNCCTIIAVCIVCVFILSVVIMSNVVCRSCFHGYIDVHVHTPCVYGCALLYI